MGKSRFVDREIAHLVTRRDYNKQPVNFDGPNLLEIQKKSYEQFLKNDLPKLIEMYFPINHPKNLSYEVRYKGIKFYDGKFTEEEARYKSQTYGKVLYVDLELVNKDTGEIKRQKSSKKDKNPHDGVFFAKIPMMTNSGTFIINGTEKFVISQIVRSPGAYILTKSQIKLARKKKVVEGYICELLPSKGTMMNFYIDYRDHDNSLIKVIVKNSTSESTETFSATQLLKAIGFSQKQIRDIFGKESHTITKTLTADGIKKSISSKFNGCYTHETIMENDEIKKIRKSIEDNKNANVKHTGVWIDHKLRALVADYLKLKAVEIKKRRIYDTRWAEYEKSGLKCVPHDLQVLREELDNFKEEINDQLDKIITEKAAMDIMNQLGVSKRSIESISLKNKDFCYQDFFLRHFLEKKYFDLSSAGRAKLNHKLRISERIYQKVLAKDILDRKGKVVLKKGALINKEQLDIFKSKIAKNELDIRKTFKLNKGSQYPKYHGKLNDEVYVESVDIYADNTKSNDSISVIGIDTSDFTPTLLISDIIAMISYAINLPYNVGSYDDIDHLGNKRVKLIHEQLRNKLVAGMARVEKHIKDKLASLATPTMNDEQKAKRALKATIKSVVNHKPFEQVFKTFFNTYQLTQFIDQQNPLSELTNKRRISAMGDGGIRRDDPNLAVRDVHYSHYGRICPIETPEGMNIGLIMSLSSFAKVDEHGFLISPYYVVKDGVITNEIRWMNASEEDEYVICDSHVDHDNNGRILQKKIVGRYRGMQEMYDVKQINYIDICPRQVVSIAASAIPFLENDDSARALMGANMQRQAVPLLKPYAPIVGTGAEYKIAHDSGVSIVAENDGVVSEVDSKHITISCKNGKNEKYKLIKYRKTNQNTCNNQTPIVNLGENVKADQVLADGPAMFNGELAIGRNPLIAYLTWHGYNFEDAIIVSSKLVQDDVYTSIEINEYTCDVVQTKNGDEEVTRDLPNVSNDVKNYLDSDGIIMIGAEVKEGDILVGKISPKGFVEYSPEEKLLNVIFGNKSHGYRDSSLSVKHGEGGIVIGVKRFKSIDGDLLDDGVIERIKIYIAQKRKLQIGDKMSGRHGNKGTISKIVPVEDMPHLEDGTPIDILLSPLGVPSRMNLGQILEVHLGWAMRNLVKKQIIDLIKNNESPKVFSQVFGLNIEKAAIFKNITKKYLESNNITNATKLTNLDLTIILNKCGLCIEDLSFKAATPVFSGAKLDDIADALKESGVDLAKTKAKVKLIDGQTGEPFPGDITIGIMYMLKLDHMVEDKIHARACGPYSKVTQQPLGGKSQNGGQRFGEMEVWALEAYGATHNLQELLTIKSDDVHGRNWTYNNIVKGKNIPKASIPNSFVLLTKQLQGLGLAISVFDGKNHKQDINDFTSVNDDEEYIKQEQKEENVVQQVETTDVDDNEFDLL